MHVFFQKFDSFFFQLGQVQESHIIKSTRDNLVGKQTRQYHLKVRLGLGLSDKTSVVQYNMHGCLGPPDYRRRWYWPQYKRKWNLSQCWLVEKHGALILWMTFLSDYFSFISIHWTATELFVWCWPNWNLKCCDIRKKKNGINRVDMTAHDCPKGTVFDFHLNMCMPVVCEQV